MVERACLGCGEVFEYRDRECPECDWSVDRFREKGRHGLEKDGHGEPEDDGRDGGGGPPPGPGGLLGI